MSDIDKILKTANWETINLSEARAVRWDDDVEGIVLEGIQHRARQESRELSITVFLGRGDEAAINRAKILEALYPDGIER